MDRALASPIRLQPIPDLFPVMIIGSHYEDRRAHERGIFPNSPGVQGMEHFFAVPSLPLLYPPEYYRVVGPFSENLFPITHKNSWDLRF